MKLKDCRLWDGTEPVYIEGFPFRVRSSQYQEMNKETLTETDRRFILAVNDIGIHYLLYWASDGFKKIVLK